MKTVYVGLSGGVDSAVSAYLLREQGYKVVGAFIKGWEPDFLPCTGADDRLQALRVAAHLGIPFETIDLEKAYKQEVVDFFVSEYRAGRTPNPDVACNRIIKFGSFWRHARERGADYIATGHYAVNRFESSGFELSTSKDTEKDQTYFLWTLRQDDLSHSLFPVGDKTKPEVRDIAKKAGLPNAVRKDSQGLCFLGHVDMHAFLKRYLPRMAGVIRHVDGRPLGEHEGAWFYTVGQHVDIGGSSKRLYIVSKDVTANVLTVHEEPQTLTPDPARRLSHMNWISGNAHSGKAFARYRYRQKLLSVVVKDDFVTFEEPQLIAQGQSLVVYSTDKIKCLGGGIVE